MKSRKRRWAGNVAGMSKMRNAYKILVEKPEGKRPLGRPRRRWKDDIKIDLSKTGLGDVDWIHQALDRDRWRVLVKMVMNLLVP
jgi:transcription termination factor 2